MAEIVFRVFDESTSTNFVYRGAQIELSNPEYEQTSDAEQIEAGSAVVRLNNDTFLDQSQPEDLPDGPFRCELEYTFQNGSQVVYLNGRIRRTQITHFAALGTWSIKCIDDSVDNFFEQLEGQLLPSTGAFEDIDTATVAEDSGVIVKTSRWWDIEDCWNELITALPEVILQYQAVRTWFYLDVVYSDAGNDRHDYAQNTAVHVL